jgi:hypothetical protein
MGDIGIDEEPRMEATLREPDNRVAIQIYERVGFSFTEASPVTITMSIAKTGFSK